MVWCAVLRCAVLCCAVLRCAVLLDRSIASSRSAAHVEQLNDFRRAIEVSAGPWLGWAVLCGVAVLCSAVLCCGVWQCCAVLCCAVLCGRDCARLRLLCC